MSKLGSKPAVLETVMALLDHCCPLLVDTRCVHMMVERVRMAKLPYKQTNMYMYYECCLELYMCVIVLSPDLIRRVYRFQYAEVGFGSGTETMCMHTCKCTCMCKTAHSNVMG